MRDLIFGLLGGTALLMYGVDKMGDGLEKASGNVMKKILSVLTGKVWSAFLVGTFLTALVQSSTAITVLTVGFVNAGLMELSQAVGIIYGANIGTTITAQLMAFSFSFKLTEIALPIVGIGFSINYFAKKDMIKHIGNAIMGFGLMFLGLKILNGGIPFIQQSEDIKYFFETYASIPLVGILLGAGATALVHSSSATIGLVLILAQAGVIDLRTAVLIMLGDNIGTCITAQLASMTGNINARRTAWAHTLYNLICVVAVWVLLDPFIWLIQEATLSFNGNGDIGLQIANSHTVFNLLGAMIFLPLNKYYVKFLQTIIRDRSHNEDEVEMLNKILLDTPVAAVKAAFSELKTAAKVGRDMISISMDALFTDDCTKLDKVDKLEEKLNIYQKDITSYLVELTNRPLDVQHSKMVSQIVNCINNVERIGDHTIDYGEHINFKIARNMSFSEDSLNELGQMKNTIIEMYNLTIQNLDSYSKITYDKVEVLEDRVDELCKKMSDNHMQRLKDGKCNIDAGVIFIDILNHFERIGDHLYHINQIIRGELANLTDEAKEELPTDSVSIES